MMHRASRGYIHAVDDSMFRYITINNSVENKYNYFCTSHACRKYCEPVKETVKSKEQLIKLVLTKTNSPFLM